MNKSTNIAITERAARFIYDDQLGNTPATIVRMFKEHEDGELEANTLGGGFRVRAVVAPASGTDKGETDRLYDFTVIVSMDQELHYGRINLGAHRSPADAVKYAPVDLSAHVRAVMGMVPFVAGAVARATGRKLAA